MSAPVRLIRRRPPFAWASLIALLLLRTVANSANAQPGPAAPAAPSPAPPAEPPALSLADCLRIAAERQPTLAAARASLAAHEAAYRGVRDLNPPRFLAPDLPVRRQQACRGMAAARAE